MEIVKFVGLDFSFSTIDVLVDVQIDIIMIQIMYVHLAYLNVFGVKIIQHANYVQQIMFLSMVQDVLMKDLLILDL